MVARAGWREYVCGGHLIGPRRRAQMLRVATPQPSRAAPASEIASEIVGDNVGSGDEVEVRSRTARVLLRARRCACAIVVESLGVRVCE